MTSLKHIFLLATALVILIPSAVSSAHIFSTHTHEVCKDYAYEHFHKDQLVCELHKFQQNSALELSFINFKPLSEPLPGKFSPIYYQFLNTYQKLPFKLRAPPTIG